MTLLFHPALQHINFDPQTCPQQTNTADCGVFMIACCWHRMSGKQVPKTLDGGFWREAFRLVLRSSAHLSAPGTRRDEVEDDVALRFNMLKIRQAAVLAEIVERAGNAAVFHQKLGQNQGMLQQFQGTLTLLRQRERNQCASPPDLLRQMEEQCKGVQAEIKALEYCLRVVGQLTTGLASTSQYCTGWLES